MNEQTSPLQMTTTYRWKWAVISPENVVMHTEDTQEKAEQFRDTAYNGYYKHCTVGRVKIHAT